MSDEPLIPTGQARHLSDALTRLEALIVQARAERFCPTSEQAFDSAQDLLVAIGFRVLHLGGGAAVVFGITPPPNSHKLIALDFADSPLARVREGTLSEDNYVVRAEGEPHLEISFVDNPPPGCEIRKTMPGNPTPASSMGAMVPSPEPCPLCEKDDKHES